MASLPHDPLLAHTQQEYDKTQVYEIVAAVTAKTCPALSSPEVARWIENVIKPHLTYTKPTHIDDVGGDSIRAENFNSKKTAFCGRTFSFESSAGDYREGFQRIPFEGVMLTIE
jgi:TPP-dependent 2-oxoacid decarboxylase